MSALSGLSAAKLRLFGREHSPNDRAIGDRRTSRRLA